MLPDVAKSLPCWLSQFRKATLRQPAGQRLSNAREQQTKISIGPILFLYHDESMVSSNLNSKQLSFHYAHPNVQLKILSIKLGYYKNLEIYAVSSLSWLVDKIASFSSIIIIFFQGYRNRNNIVGRPSGCCNF